MTVSPRSLSRICVITAFYVSINLELCFSFESNCQQLRVTRRFANAVWDERSGRDERKILLSRASRSHLLYLSLMFSRLHAWYVCQLSTRKSASFCLLSKRRAPRRTKILSNTIHVFALSSLSTSRRFDKLDFRVSKNRSTKEWIGAKDNWQTCERIFLIFANSHSRIGWDIFFAYKLSLNKINCKCEFAPV